jgi:hypothetical protein
VGESEEHGDDEGLVSRKNAERTSDGVNIMRLVVEGIGLESMWKTRLEIRKEC